VSPQKFQMDDYIDVAARIAEFRDKYPDGRLRPADPVVPYRIETIGNETYIVVVAAAHRDKDDTLPGVGMAYEVFPGKTPYTRGSELQNAETSAWGRAIVAALAADTKRGVASAEEVRNRAAEREEPLSPPDPRIQLQHDIKALADELGWSVDEVLKAFDSDYDKDIRKGDAAELRAFLDWLSNQPSKWESNPAGEPA
jgi:hypothetical protein